MNTQNNETIGILMVYLIDIWSLHLNITDIIKFIPLILKANDVVTS